MSTWHLLPWWTVPVFLLASLLALFVRGLVKANYEEFQKLEQTIERQEEALRFAHRILSRNSFNDEMDVAARTCAAALDTSSRE